MLAGHAEQLGEGGESSRALAGAAQDLSTLLEDLCRTWQDGRIKLYLISRVLRVRSSHAELFARGRYVPIVARGDASAHVVALARNREEDWILAAAPRQVTRWQSTGAPLGRFPFGEEWLSLPEEAPRRWRDALSGEERVAREGRLPVSSLFRRFPVSLLVSGPPAGESASSRPALADSDPTSPELEREDP